VRQPPKLGLSQPGQGEPVRGTSSTINKAEIRPRIRTRGAGRPDIVKQATVSATLAQIGTGW